MHATPGGGSRRLFPTCCLPQSEASKEFRLPTWFLRPGAFRIVMGPAGRGANARAAQFHPESSALDPVQHNVAAHNRLAAAYETRHPEIFNDVEQARLPRDLGEALAAVRTGCARPRVLDFGCGSGNLTRHLLALGADVVAADVAEEFLRRLKAQLPGARVETFLLNGRDLDGLAAESFDAAATYSVLHHIPDYLAAVRELARVLKPGGVLVIDHEVAPGYWTPSPELEEFRRLVKPPPPSPPGPSRFLNPATYTRKLRALLDPTARERRRRRAENPRWQEEGDIHIWPDDHIEWNKIEAALNEQGFELVFRKDFLHGNAKYPRDAYEQFKNRCTDMRVLAMRKGGGGSGES